MRYLDRPKCVLGVAGGFFAPAGRMAVATSEATARVQTRDEARTRGTDRIKFCPGRGERLHRPAGAEDEHTYLAWSKYYMKCIDMKHNHIPDSCFLRGHRLSAVNFDGISLPRLHLFLHAINDSFMIPPRLHPLQIKPVRRRG